MEYGPEEVRSRSNLKPSHKYDRRSYFNEEKKPIRTTYSRRDEYDNDVEEKMAVSHKSFAEEIGNKNILKENKRLKKELHQLRKK